MALDIEKILDLIDETKLNRIVGQVHDEARETFKLRRMFVENAREFKWLITSYHRHHMNYTGQGTPSEDSSFGEVRNLLDRLYDKDPYQDGYNVALMEALQGKLQDVINQIAASLKGRAMRNYQDHVYFDYVDPLSKEDNRALSRAFFARYGSDLRRFGQPFDPDSFAWNTRGALEYLRGVINLIRLNARKI